MYSDMRVNGSKSSAAPKGLTALLIGAIVCYQVVNYTLLNKALPDEDGPASDDACAATGGEGTSSLCMEARLFRGWHEMPVDSAEELEQLLAVSPRRTQDLQSPTTSAPASRAPSDKLRSKHGHGGGSAETAKAAEVAKEHILEVEPSKPSMLAAARADKKEHNVSFSHELTDLQQQLEARMHAHARKSAEHRALRALSVAARGTQQGSEVPVEDEGMTPWAHKLDDLTHELSEHMEARRKARAEQDAAHAAARAAARSTVHAAQKNPGKTVDSGDHSLLGEIQTLGQELCKDPSRHNLPVCVQFLRSQPAPVTASRLDEEHHKHAHSKAMQLLEKQMENLQKEEDKLHKEEEHNHELLRQESNEFMREMCSDPARKSYPACVKFYAHAGVAAKPPRGLRGTAPKPQTTMPPVVANVATRVTRGLRGEGARPTGMHWPAAKEWEALTKAEHGVAQVDTTPVLFFRHDLRGSHWTGKIPKVACVTVLAPGQASETLMRYFMDNYNLQKYEGPRQLVIVYHSQDRETARIAHLHADGSSVVAAAARGEGDFPSAMAYRFGAWLAHDADIVARWDFDAFHHPNRLAMQVHAMVLGKRPASIVTRATFFDAAGGNSTKLGGVGPHGSMMGEAAWMRKNWMPLLEEENQVLLGVQARHVVQVEMPELLAYHDA